MRRLLILMLFVFSLASVCRAQPPGDPNGGNKPGSNPVPIEGVSLLLAAGAFLGARKLIRKKD